MKNLDVASFSGKRVLIRVDFNVPLNDNFNITDDSRILAAVPTIKMVAGGGGKVILMSHLGRPKNGPENSFSLKHIINHLSNVLETTVAFSDNLPVKFTPTTDGIFIYTGCPTITDSASIPPTPHAKTPNPLIIGV